MKKNKLIITALTLFVCVGLFYSSCVTNKNTFMHRGWHNMNSRYNGYFLAGEQLKEAVKKIEKNHKDDFTKPIPVFIYPSRETVNSDTAELNKVIDRATTVINRHAIVSEKGKVEIANACKWIDENYGIIASADLYKLEYFPALEIFEYVTQKYPDPEAKYRGMLGKMRTYNELGSLSKTEILIDEIKSAKDYPKKKWYKHELAILSADCYIKRGNNSAAIQSLTEAIKTTKKRQKKARYYYVLAQLYSQVGEQDKAIAAYDKVIKYQPSYEMVFNAKINRAGIYAQNNAESKNVKRELVRMSKDVKNNEYLDQIFYSLALLSYKDKDTVATLKYLDKSIENSISNNPQKALSFLKRGDIYVDQQNYKNAELNYDSALTLLPKEYPNYVKIEDKKKSLSSLVENLNIITLQDSLQRLSKMDEKEREKEIEKMIRHLKKEERKRKEEERQKELIRQQIAAQNQAAANAATQASGAKAWYFYNPNTVSLGVADFTKKWGNRKLEDNWRRSQKQEESSDENDDTKSVSAKDSVAKASVDSSDFYTNIKSKDEYLKTIPSSNEEILKSNEKLIDAYYNVGVIYKEQLNNNIKSVTAFEELLNRFPDNKYKLTSYYQLYRTYTAMNNGPKAEYYKNILLNNYPETEYAKIIRNPDYAKDLVASKNEIEKLYNQTYQYYLSKNYNAAIENCNLADSIYSKNYLMPQFDLIKAMSIGYTQNQKALEAALTKVVIKHPIGPVKDKAQGILDLMKKQQILTDSVNKKSEIDRLEHLSYYWLAVVPKQKGDIEKFKEKITMITESAFTSSNLLVGDEALNSTEEIVYVKTFATKTKATEYVNFIENKKELFVDIENIPRQIFLISDDDYKLMKEDKDVNKYVKFYNEKLK